jgi:4'-phosphopantetheinyl transferase
MTASWREPRQPRPLAAEVHVWRAELDRGDERAEPELPADERERAAGMRSDRIRRRWVAARRALRLVLGGYLDEDPARIALQLGSRGKPELAAPSLPLRFNLSHSGDLALVAVALDREVGVDVEAIKQRRGLAELARRALSADEAAAVRAAPAEAQLGVFHDAWVRHEAIAKCLGVGLGAPLPAAPVTVSALDTGPGYAAAIAVAGEAPAPLQRFAL